jgi:capsular exopolysaccharide synthesis family protein
MISRPTIHSIDDEELLEDVSSALKLRAEVIEIETDQHSRLVFLTDPYGLAVERYKLLRSRLFAMSPQGGLILVTSPSSGDGKTLTSANLSWSLAEAGRQTCLVDLDFRAPSVGHSLGYEVPADDDGVVEVLMGKSTLDRAIRRVRDRSLYVLGIKEPLKSTSQLLDGETLRPMFTRLREAFEWVILDMPPAIPMSDVAEVLPFVDGALMVVRSGRTTKALIEPTAEMLGNKAWGVVLNDSLINGSAYYGYYGYGEDRKRKN